MYERRVLYSFDTLIKRLSRRSRLRSIKLLVVVTIAIVSMIISLPKSALAASNSKAIIAYITWQNISQRWNGGSGLASESSLDMLTDIIAPAVNPSTASSPNITGMYGGNLATLKTIANAGHAYGCMVGPYLYTDSSGSYGPTLAQIVSAGAIDTLVNSISSLLTTYNLDGITLDPEDDSSASTLNTVLKALRSGLPSDKYIDITGRPYTAPNISLESMQYLRYIQVMTYDMGWGGSPSGYPQASIEATEAGMKMWSDAGFPKAKLVMGIPTYGRTAYVSTQSPKQESMQYYDILTQNTNAYNLDYATLNASSGLTRDFWWGSAATDTTKARWSVDNGYAGVMIFTLGYDRLNDSRSLVKAIYDGINGGSTPTETPPVITTNSATGVTTTGAVLNGNLTATGSSSPVTLSFEYGTTTGYGSTITGAPSTLSGAGSFSAGISGLTSNRLYHYRARAVGAGTSSGSDQTFTTTATVTSLIITSPSLSDGQVGSVYSQTLSASGGTTPYTWSIVSGTLPAGLSFSSGGVISGIPEVISSMISITFLVSDDSGSMETKSLSITVIHSAWDINQDGMVNVLDAEAIGQHLGETGTPGWIPEDINMDGIIDISDFAKIGLHWTG